MAFNFIRTDIEGVYVIEPKVFGDDRGYFMETYQKDVFDKAGLVYDFVQVAQRRPQRSAFPDQEAAGEACQGRRRRSL